MLAGSFPYAVFPLRVGREPFTRGLHLVLHAGGGMQPGRASHRGHAASLRRVFSAMAGAWFHIAVIQ